MYGIKQLKDKVAVLENEVECPVKGCTYFVERQKKVFRTDNQFLCPEHNIFISPSTFEYINYTDNVLWTDPSELSLLEKIIRVKRECRMARDNSEDSVTWNVFRYMERNNLIVDFLSNLIKVRVYNPDLKYWSYQKDKGTWSKLNETRIKFGEQVNRGTEPDIIITTPNELFFVEAKVSSGNNTVPSNNRSIGLYEKGANNWSSTVFRTSLEDISVKHKKYELMRLWLLGSWLADQMNKKFVLINLVLREREMDIKNVFGCHIVERPERTFLRTSWEDIYDFIDKSGPVKDKQKIIDYFKNKSLGYNSRGQLIKAFSV